MNNTGVGAVAAVADRCRARGMDGGGARRPCSADADYAVVGDGGVSRIAATGRVDAEKSAEYPTDGIEDAIDVIAYGGIAGCPDTGAARARCLNQAAVVGDNGIRCQDAKETPRNRADEAVDGVGYGRIAGRPNTRAVPPRRLKSSRCW